ncbi:MAG: MFS transporter [Spirochaetia bacterium]|jgi:MFS family permease
MGRDGGSSLAVFRNRDFPAFLAARALASLSSLMLTVAVGWHVYDLTGSAFALGMVGLAQFLPALLLALPGGLAADRFERRTILLFGFSTQVVVALLLLSISLVPGAGAAWIFPVVALIGIAQAFLGPASQSLVPFLVPKEDFPRAVAWNSSTFQIATIAGPAIGGLLYAFGPACVYAVSAGCYACSVLLVSRVRTRLRVAASAKPGFEGLLTGLRFVFSRPTILGAISMDLFAVLFGGATALLPIYARDILHVGPWGLGLLRSAPAVGAAIVAFGLAQRPLARRAGARMFFSVAVFGVMTIVFGLSRSFLLSLAALAGLGAADMVSVVVRQTLVQINTPDEKRGRVSAVNSIFIGASNQLGEFESGVTAAWLGTVPAVVLGGAGTLVVVLLWIWLFPTLRQADRLDAGPRAASPEKTPTDPRHQATRGGIAPRE